MDNTGLHYLTYDPDAIWKEMMIAYDGAGGDVLWPGDEKEILLRGVQACFVQVFAGVDNALLMQTLRYAVGDYLNMLGELRGCERIKAAAAHATVIVTTNANGNGETLPAGTTMTSDGEIFYQLVEDLTLAGYVQSYTVEVEATREGVRGNGLLAGTQLQLAVSNAAVSSIVTATDASGGSNEEDDESYRERIRVYGDSSVTTGAGVRYESVTKAVSTEIIDAVAVNAGAGQVGVYLILASGANETAIIQAVEAALSDRSVRPLTDTVSVQVASEVPYTLNVKVQADTGVTLTSLQAAVSGYQQWQDNSVGQTFDPYRLVAMLYLAGATLVEWGEGSEFGDGGAIERTAIAETERCSGTITLTLLP